jgi:hypothetical protein
MCCSYYTRSSKLQSSSSSSPSAALSVPSIPSCGFPHQFIIITVSHRCLTVGRGGQSSRVKGENSPICRPALGVEIDGRLVGQHQFAINHYSTFRSIQRAWYIMYIHTFCDVMFVFVGPECYLLTSYYYSYLIHLKRFTMFVERGCYAD